MEIEMYLYVLTAEAATQYEIENFCWRLRRSSRRWLCRTDGVLYLAEPGEAGAKDDVAGARITRHRNPTKIEVRRRSLTFSHVDDGLGWECDV